MMRIGLWRTRLALARLLRLPVDYTPPASVARDHNAALALLWDGRWFLKTAAAHGEADAVARNSEVRVSLARTEMKLMLAAVGRSRARDLDDALRLVKGHAGAFMKPAGGLAYSQAKQPDGSVTANVNRCAAFEGAREAHKRGLVSRKDQACIHCTDVWSAWFEATLPGEHVRVDRGEYQGAGNPVCRFRFQVVAGPTRTRTAEPGSAGDAVDAVDARAAEPA